MGKNACGMGINMILDVIVEDKKKRLVEHKAAVSEEEMKQKALQSTRKSVGFAKALKKDGLSVIGEFKKASPSHGAMDIKVDLKERILQYNDSVDAISCLTEEDHFYGSTAYLEQIRKMTNLPVIRKDFIIEEYQVYEAKVIGADAILLIAAILDDEIIGINNRNLKTFEVTMDTTKKLSAMLPKDFKERGKVLVSESGVSTDGDISALKQSHADAFLIGTALMESDNPGALTKHWKEVYANG